MVHNVSPLPQCPHVTSLLWSICLYLPETLANGLHIFSQTLVVHHQPTKSPSSYSYNSTHLQLKHTTAWISYCLVNIDTCSVFFSLLPLSLFFHLKWFFKSYLTTVSKMFIISKAQFMCWPNSLTHFLICSDRAFHLWQGLRKAYACTWSRTRDFRSWVAHVYVCHTTIL